MKETKAITLLEQAKTKVKDANLLKKINKIVKKSLDEQKGKPVRKGEFETRMPVAGSVKPELLRKADDLYILSNFLKCDPRSLNLWKTYESDISELRKAMDTQTTAEGFEWIPTGFSTELIERVKLALKVAALFRRFNMPTPTYRFPAEGVEAVAYLAPESVVDSSTKITASTPRTRRVTFEARKLAARVMFSEEMTEDSLIPVLPFIKDKLVEALAVAEETSVINGVALPGPHQDIDVVNPLDARFAWDGLRLFARTCAGGVAQVNFGGTAAGFTTVNMRAIREAMGIYGVDPDKLTWITSTCGYNGLLNNVDVLTLDKYGPNATILKGELGKFDNIPIVVSEYVRRDLDANGVYSGPGNNLTIMLLVYRDGFMFGDRRKVTLKTKEDIEVDQTISVATQRLDFQGLYLCATETLVGAGINVGPCR
ncbi:hypothetical protein ES702_07009 [subsurface metagenome]